MEVLLLVGIPGSGKTTYIDNHNLRDKYVVVSADSFIERKALEDGISYDEAWFLYKKDIPKDVNRQIEEAVENKLSVLVDMTNLSPKNILTRFPLTLYTEKNAIIFPPVPTWEQMQIINQKRKGKTIRQAVYEVFKQRFDSMDWDEFKKIFNQVTFIERTF